MTNYSELCQEAADIHQSKAYIFVLALVVILNFTGLILLLNTTAFLVKTRKICLNLRFLLISLSISLIARDLLTSARALYRIYLAITVTNACDFTSTKQYCVIESAVTGVPFNVALYLFPVISGERLLATMYRKIDEKRIFTYLVYAAIGITWTSITFFKVDEVLTAAKASTKIMSYCSSVMAINEINYFNYFVNVQFIFPLVALAVCIGICIFCKNKKDRFFKTHAATHSLTERYNLSEIIRTSQIVLLLSSTFYVLYIFYQLFLLVTVLHFQINTLREFSVIKEISSLCLMPIFVNIYGLTFLTFQKKAFRKPTITSVLVTDGSSAQRTPNFVSPVRIQTNMYFRFYAKLWK